MTAPDPASGGPPALATDDEADRWREAARLRRDHPGWIIVWLAPAGEFHAYRRLPGTRRDTALAAVTDGELGVQISHAEQTTRTPRPDKDKP